MGQTVEDEAKRLAPGIAEIPGGQLAQRLHCLRWDRQDESWPPAT